MVHHRSRRNLQSGQSNAIQTSLGDPLFGLSSMAFVVSENDPLTGFTEFSVL
jgi:hypothetical protein